MKALQENQFKIIESLNQILARVDLDPIKIHGEGAPGANVPHGVAMSHEVADLERRVTDLTERLADLSAIIREAFDKLASHGSGSKDMQEYVDSHMELLHHKLEASEHAVKETVAAHSSGGDGGGHRWSMYLVFFFVGVVLMNVVRTLRKNSKSKKFI